MASSITMAPARMMSARSALSPRIFRRFRWERLFQALADRRDVGLQQPQPVAVLALPAVRPEVNAGQRADGAAHAHHDLAAAGRRQDAQELLADLACAGPAARAAWAGSWRRKRLVVRTAPSGRLAMETTLRSRTRLSCRLAPPRSATTPSLKGRLSSAA